MTDAPQLTFLQEQCRDLLIRLLPNETTAQDVNTVSTAFYQGVASCLNQIADQVREGTPPSITSLAIAHEVRAYVEARHHLNQLTGTLPRLIPDLPPITPTPRK